jgi:hypothetical protein
LPDVVTLDINMPEMDGITALSLIMAERPVPVVMVSSLTEQGALATFEALNLGAVDYIVKPGGTISLSIGAIKAELVGKVRAATCARLRDKGRPRPGLAQRPPRPGPVPRPFAVRRGVAGEGLLIVGVSTGGPRTLEDILPFLPADFPWPVLVAQHMPASFTRPFAERLNALCPLSVVEAAHPLPLEAGTIYIGKGGADMLLSQRGGHSWSSPSRKTGSSLAPVGGVDGPFSARALRSLPRRGGDAHRHGLRRGRCLYRNQEARRPHDRRVARVGRGLRDAGGTHRTQWRQRGAASGKDGRPDQLLGRTIGGSHGTDQDHDRAARDHGRAPAVARLRPARHPLDHANPVARRWAARDLIDCPGASAALADRLQHEDDLSVREVILTTLTCARR